MQSMIDAVDLCGGADLCAEASFVASAAPLGALLAAAVAGRLLDSYGRRTFLIAVSALWVAGYVVVACASSLLGFALGRAVAGAAMGATSVAVPVYAAELAPPKLRGPLGGLFNVFISAGILAVFALGARGTDENATLPPFKVFIRCCRNLRPDGREVTLSDPFVEIKFFDLRTQSSGAMKELHHLRYRTTTKADTWYRVCARARVWRATGATRCELLHSCWCERATATL